MNLTYLLQSLLKRKWIILGSTLLTLLLTTIFLLYKKKLYESTAQYSTGFTIQQVSLVNEEFNTFEADTKFNNVLETFKSPKVIGVLSYDLLLHDILHPDLPFRKLTTGKLHSDKYTSVDLNRAKFILSAKIDSLALLSTVIPEEKKLLELLELYEYDYLSLEKTLLIERIPRTDYLNIVFRSENPLLSSFVVNRIGEEFLRFYKSLGSTLSSESVEKISDIVDQKKKQVDSITENLRKLKASQGTLDPVELSKNAMLTVNQLSSKLADEKAEYNKTFYQLQSVNKQLDNLGNSNGVTGSGAVALGSNQEIVRIRTKLKELAPNKDDPRVGEQIKKLQDDLKNQQALLNGASSGGNLSETQRSLLVSQKSDLEEQLKASDQTVGYLTREIAKYSALNNSDGGSDVKINALKNEVTIATKEYSDIKSKYMQAEGYQQTPIINFKQTLIGQPAVEPEPSHFLLFLGIAGVSMLSFCSLIIILLELLDSSIKAPSRFKDSAGLELMDIMNRLDLGDGSLPAVFSGMDQGRGSSPDEAMFMRFIRKMRYNIDSSGKKIILVTSTKKGEGKTTVIEALACSLSMINKKVLIIDTQFSNNSLTRNFKATGLLEEFSSQIPLSLDLKPFRYIVHPSSLRGVDIVGCKGGDYTPDEILGKGNLLVQLDVLVHQYDYILLEGASLNDNADAKELSRYVQGIVAVFAADSVINQSDRESIQFLVHEQQKFIGSILNKVERENIDI